MPVGNTICKLIIISCFLAACTPLVAARSRDITETTIEFIKLFARGTLSVNAAQKLLGNAQQPEHLGDYWQIQSNSRLEEIVLRSETMDEPADEAQLRLSLESGVMLRHLEKALGSWHLVFASKTSSVVFRVTDQAAKPALVFARLFTSRPLPESPVLAVQLRWVE